MNQHEFRYDTSGNWYKGNTHIHTTRSDGGKTPDEVARMYSDAGYDFIFITDHWAASHFEGNDSFPLLVFDGIELDGKDSTGSLFHIVCLGKFEGLDKTQDLEESLKTAASQGGMLILAHPYWTGNTIEDSLRHKFHGVEIYNHVCTWLNGKGSGGYLWDRMLEHSPGTLGFAVDDAHIQPVHPGWNGGWIMVNAPEINQKTIMSAIRKGNYYSTCGPLFSAITLENGKIRVSTSPVRFIRMAGPQWHGERRGDFDGGILHEALFDVPDDWEYMRIEIEDENGRRAWTNTLFNNRS